jgi:hypothetical protein
MMDSILTFCGPVFLILGGLGLVMSTQYRRLGSIDKSKVMTSSSILTLIAGLVLTFL